MMGYSPNTWLINMFKQSDSSERSSTTVNRVRRNADFTRSFDMALQNDQPSVPKVNSSDFTQSVAVVPSSTDGKYSVYPGIHENVNNTQTRKTTSGPESEGPDSWYLSSLSFGHNINNPELRSLRADSSDWLTRKQSVSLRTKQSGSSGSRSSLSSSSKQSEESGNIKQTGSKSNTGSGPGSKTGSGASLDRISQASSKRSIPEHCQCNGLYHSHKFHDDKSLAFGRSVQVEKKFIPRRKSTEVWQANDNQTTICNMFWRSEMSFCGYIHGDKLTDFKSLWPTKRKIEVTLADSICVEGTGLREALWEMIQLTMCGGPVWVLQALLDLKFIGKDFQYEGDCNLLHLACVLQNAEAVQICSQYGVLSNIKDRSGKTPFDVCGCPRIRKQIQNVSAKLQALTNKNRPTNLYTPTQHDIDILFKMAGNPKCLYEFQKRIQTFDVNINRLQKDGQYFVHVAAQAGLGHLPFLMSIVRLQKADIDMYNIDGMTPLMIAAQEGNETLCELLMCIFGADPNKQNNKTKKTALHYAVFNHYISVVNCLIKRGADFNIEDEDMCRPDDVFVEASIDDDCCEAILSHRERRMEDLKEKVILGSVEVEDLRKTDISVVDNEDYTLIMLAAQNDRVHNLATLLTVSKDTINAQHSHTGLTALSMAAKNGNDECCRVLFRYGAGTAIPDMQYYLAIHHAVLNNHEAVVDAFREQFPDAFTGLHKALNLCRKSSIHDKLTDAFNVRQEKIVSPQLRICSMEGDAGKLFCLLEEGDDVNRKSDLNSLPAIFIAVEYGHVEVLKLLTEKGADLTKRDPRTGNTVLHVATLNGQQQTVDYLLKFCKTSPGKHKKKLDVNSMNNEKKTALQIACEKGYNKIVKRLLDNGATTALLNPQGTLFTTAEYEGARSLIEARRNEHTILITKLVTDKSKKALQTLAEVWMPRFDHNLRDRLGDTPLMLACVRGLSDTVKFLLQTAVYLNQITEEDSDNSDADSGVTDLPPWRSYRTAKHDEFMRSLDQSGEFESAPATIATYDITRSLNPSDCLNSLPGLHPVDNSNSKMTSYLTDVERPKGLYIYHDSIVSHVCAVNLFDGNTPLHRTIEGGDHVVIATNLVEADGAVINMQNDAGFTPIHLACKLKRKKILEKLLAVKGVDLSLRTLNGELPEEVTKNKSMIRMVKASRNGQPASPQFTHTGNMPTYANSFTESLPSVISQGGGSTINFDRVNDMYTSLRTQRK